MIFSYNNLQQPNGAASVIIPEPEILRDEFGAIQKIVVRWIVNGELFVPEGYTTEQGQSWLASEIARLERFYNQDGGDAILRFDGTTTVAHYMRSRDTRGGVRSSFVGYPIGDGVELVNGRRWTLSLMGEYAPPIARDGLNTFQESLMIQGDGGPQYVIRTTRNTTPVRQLVSRATPVMASQVGSATAYGNYPIPPAPIWPQYLVNPATAITRQSPQQIGSGRYSALSLFTVNWDYRYESPVPLSGYPTQRTR